MNFIFKELIDTFTYSTINKDRKGSKLEVINGREYLKFGTYQAVTVVGNLFKYTNLSDNSVKEVLLIGVAKQHPDDIMINEEAAYEAAQLSSYADPVMTVKVEGKFSRDTFVDYAKTYIDSLDLKLSEQSKK